MTKLILTKIEIDNEVNRLADFIVPYNPEIIVPVMTGGMVFASDLGRALYDRSVDCAIYPFFPNRFVVVPRQIWKKRVLIVDGVFDSGATDHYVRTVIATYKPSAMVTAVMVWKNLPNVINKPDYFGIDLKGDNKYVIGYGMDENQKHRGSRSIFYRS